MRNKPLIVGIALLSAFIAYGVWKVVFHERLPVFYAFEVEGIVGLAEDVVNRHPVQPQELRQGAIRLRERYQSLLVRASDDDKRRPSFRKVDEIVSQIEYAALKPDSQGVVESRFRTARDGIAQVKSMLGTNQDQPQ